MVTNIGNTAAKTIISDNATPSSGTYAWYLTCEKPKRSWALGALVKIAQVFGITLSKKGYKLDNVWTLDTIISTKTDWENLQKAIGTWEKASTALYLSVQNELAVNFAQYPTYATPTTLAQMIGHLSNYQEEITANNVIVKIQFNQFTTAV